MANGERSRGRLGRETVLALEQILGPYLDEGALGPFVLGSEPLPPLGHGVYVVLDTTGACAYVGKVCSDKDSSRLVTRVSEHLRDPVKREYFDCLYFFPVRAQTSNARVEWFEGWVSRHLRPNQGRRSPRVTP